MRSHSDILKAAGLSRIVEVCPGPPINTIRSWFQRGSIPDGYWKAISDADLATLEELAADAAIRKAA